MASFKGVVWLLILFCLGWSSPSFAQQALPPPSTASIRPLLTAADTVAVLHDLFQTKRQTSVPFLAAAPVALGLTVVAVAVLALGQLSGNSPSVVPPVMVLLGGTVGSAGLLNRYTRYTKGNEQEILSKYERTHKLPKWLKRRLHEYKAPKS